MRLVEARQVGSARKTLARVQVLSGRLVRPSCRLFAYKDPSDLKVTGISASVHEKLRSSAANAETKFRGTELCSSTLPERRIAPGVHRHRLHRHLHRLC